MPRKARIDAPGALHHVMGRGIDGYSIYREDGDREDFLGRLQTLLAETKTKCYAWALIPNHFHLLLKTGKEPLSGLMRRLLTGYSVGFNKRYNRKGHLFQNRYRSILCQEDAYLLELVRYIHLNPIRAGIINDMKDLDQYPYCGHSALMGNISRPWQDTEWVLSLFDRKGLDARRKLRRFMQAGLRHGSITSEVGAADTLYGSAVGAAEKGKKKQRARQKSDDRILGDPDFVIKVLRSLEKNSYNRQRLKASGFSMDSLTERVASITGLDEWQVLQPSKERASVRARSLFCYWAVKELGVTMTEVAGKLGISVSGVSRLAGCGERLAEKERLLLENFVSEA